LTRLKVSFFFFSNNVQRFLKKHHVSNEQMYHSQKVSVNVLALRFEENRQLVRMVYSLEFITRRLIRVFLYVDKFSASYMNFHGKRTNPITRLSHRTTSFEITRPRARRQPVRLRSEDSCRSRVHI